MKKIYCNFASNVFYSTGKYKTFTNYLKKKFHTIADEFDDDGETFNGEVQIITHKNKRYYYIWTRNHNNQQIYHEALHACLRIAEYLGIPTDARTSEFLTYLQEDFVEQIKN